MNDIAVQINKPKDVRAVFHYDRNNNCKGVDLYMDDTLILFDPKNPEAIVAGFLIALATVGIGYTYSAEQRQVGRWTKGEVIDE